MASFDPNDSKHVKQIPIPSAKQSAEKAAREYEDRLVEQSMRVYASTSFLAGWNAHAAQDAAASERGEDIELDCGDNSCNFAKNKTGMRTNGGCRCFDKAGIRTRSTIKASIEMLPLLLSARAELEALKAALEKIREGNALMAEGEGDNPETYKEMALHWMNVADEALRPADKKEHGE